MSDCPTTGSEPTITISYSELECGRTCPHKHELAYKQRWYPPREPRPLEIGKLWHSTLEAHYRQLQIGRDLRAARAAARKVWTDSGSTEAATIEFMYSQYVDHYGRDEEWKILAVEHAAQVPLPWSGHGPRFILKVKIDVVARTLGPRPKIWIWDHKSHSNLPTESELDLHDQFALYEAAMRILGKDIFGCLYSTTRYFVPKSGVWDDPERYMQRVPLYRTPEELDRIVEEALDDLNTIYSYPPERAPRHPVPKTCKWCHFKDPCIVGRKRGPAYERDFLLNKGFRQEFTRH